jgi:hypothetical protein
MSSFLGGIFLLPVEDLLKMVLIIAVVLIAVVMQAFFFWGKLEEKFIDELYPKLMLRLYKSDDFVEFLIERQKKKGKHEIGS